MIQKLNTTIILLLLVVGCSTPGSSEQSRGSSEQSRAQEDDRTRIAGMILDHSKEQSDAAKRRNNIVFDESVANLKRELDKLIGKEIIWRVKVFGVDSDLVEVIGEDSRIYGEDDYMYITPVFFPDGITERGVDFEKWNPQGSVSNLIIGKQCDATIARQLSKNDVVFVRGILIRHQVGQYMVKLFINNSQLQWMAKTDVSMIIDRHR